MSINKRTTIFMVAINVIYLLFGIGKFFYFNETVFVDFNRRIPQLSKLNYLLLAFIPGVLILIIYIGLFWVIKIFNEKKWVRSGLIVFFCADVVIFLLPLTMIFNSHEYGFSEIQFLVSIVAKISNAYLFITFFFVRNPSIRRYFWGFAGLMIACRLIEYFSPILYDDFGKSWLLVNSNVIFYIPFVCTLTLFVEVFNLSRQQNNAVEPQALE